MRKTLFLFLALILLVLIMGCNNQNNDKKTKIDAYFCDKDADCIVKDVHNCCGYYPRCVNKNHIPDIEAVRRECKEKGIVSICGFPEIKECKCVENKCESIEGDVVI